MGQLTIDICDKCGERIMKDKLIIYRISFWGQYSNTERTRDYLKERDCGLLFCSKDCLGSYIYNLVLGD